MKRAHMRRYDIERGMRYVLLAGMIGCAGLLRADSERPVDERLAVMLGQEGDHPAAAVEFRRLALAHPVHRSAYYEAAASEYLRMHDPQTAQRVLDRAEYVAPDPSPAMLFLRAESAREVRDYAEARYYYEVIQEMPDANEQYRAWAARRLATFDVMQQNLPEAIRRLEHAPGDQRAGIAAIREYEQGRDKSPRLGGLLGLIPGLGYAYSGEYANAVRSLILNGLFIYGMVATAEQEQWGGFAVICFFELTWYSGSIYGGFDAAHRYNRRRHDQALDGITGRSAWRPDYEALPSFSLTFEF